MTIRFGWILSVLGFRDKRMTGFPQKEVNPFPRPRLSASNGHGGGKSPMQKMSTHEKKNEGGREFGHVHSPSQTEMAKENAGLADDVGQQQQQNRQQPQRRQPEQPHPLKKKSA